jgi:hypothetical protein
VFGAGITLASVATEQSRQEMIGLGIDSIRPSESLRTDNAFNSFDTFEVEADAPAKHLTISSHCDIVKSRRPLVIVRKRPEGPEQ